LLSHSDGRPVGLDGVPAGGVHPGQEGEQGTIYRT
jgi:hypothetical protein